VGAKSIYALPRKPTHHHEYYITINILYNTSLLLKLLALSCGYVVTFFGFEGLGAGFCKLEYLREERVEVQQRAKYIYKENKLNFFLIMVCKSSMNLESSMNCNLKQPLYP